MEPDVRIERSGDGVYIRSGQDSEEDVLYLYDYEIALAIKLLVQELEWFAQGKPTFKLTSKGKQIINKVEKSKNV